MRLDFEVLELRTRHSFAIARAASMPVRHSIWVRVQDNDEVTGWGEAAVTTPYYGETAETATAVLPLLGATLEEAAIGDPFALERIEAAVQNRLGGNSAVKTAISAALHDLVGKKLEVPVWRLWGLDPVGPISSFTIAIDDVERMRERVIEAAAYPILKIKVGTARDEEILGMIREEAPDKTIRVDANTGWTVKQTLAALPMLEEYGVELIEQPLPPDDLEGMRAVTAASTIPTVADESCKTAADIPDLVGAVDVINIKLSKCGSLREGLRMVHCARAHHMQVMLGCMIESTLGVAAAIQLAPLVDYVDLDGAALLAADPFQGPGIDPDGKLRFNEAPGLGVTCTSS
ncbi:MAG: dipeptide epimerase [Gemmatimonas sp.]|nr:dipeptide epimerase [Gemmatimonas sp.]